MSYLEEFQNQINNRDFHKFFQLWEEYCTNDEVDSEEFIALLDMIKQSDFSKLFGQFAETALPLWQCVTDKEEAYQVLKRIFDLQTSNSPMLAETALAALESRYGADPKYKEKLRQIGLRTLTNFQGALSNFELLTHMDVGKFVYHTSGWGTGEIMDLSLIREQVAIEFENVTGIKHLTFENAFKTLIPLSDKHILARRFANPDLLEKQAKEDPLEVIKALLRDLGPKTAGEIKDEFCELVIPEAEWSRWWQGARSRLKKDTMVETPNSLKEPFKLRKKELTHEDEMHQAIEEQFGVDDIVQTTYSYVRDLPHVLRKKDVKDALKDKLVGLLEAEYLSSAQELQICVFLESLFGHQIEGKSVKDFIRSLDNIEEVLNSMDIIAFKKRALNMVRDSREDWPELFASLLFSVQQNALRDYIFTELQSPESRPLLMKQLNTLLRYPDKYPEIFVWYFQKVCKKNPGDIPFSTKEGQCQFFEAFLILLQRIEHESEWKDLVKKMYNLLTAKRFEVVRNLIEGTTLEFIKEFLLLVAKVHIFSDHDKKIMRSLAQVVHPSLAPTKKRSIEDDPSVLWTTEEGFRQTQERVQHIATVEMVENAKEVEEARSHGDLRENSEYKFACERRSRLQSEMKDLSKLLGIARVITPDDIDPHTVGVGSIVEVANEEGDHQTYTILGPWEADPDKQIISYQSQMAMAMCGNKIGDSFKFRDEELKITNLKSFFEV
jgi:transcription elongation factor GreA